MEITRSFFVKIVYILMGTAIIGIALKLSTTLNTAMILPFFPDVFDVMVIVFAGLFLVYTGVKH